MSLVPSDYRRVLLLKIEAQILGGGFQCCADDHENGRRSKTEVHRREECFKTE
jgi:hypothetical protein